LLTGDGEDAVTFNTATGEEVSAEDEELWEDLFAEFEDEFLPGQQEAEGAEKRSLATAVTAFMKSKGITDAYQRRGFLSRIEGSYVQVGAMQHALCELHIALHGGLGEAFRVKHHTNWFQDSACRCYTLC
jgi:hypothetical protein